GGHSVDRRRAGSRAARFAGTEYLYGRLLRLESACRGDLVDQRFDVRAQEFGRLMTRRADEVKVARMPERRLEARSPFAEVPFARDARADHPLKRAIHGRPSDFRVLAANQIAE